MKRALIFSYGLFSYSFFFVTFLCAIGFIGNLWVPKSIDAAPTLGTLPALAIDLGLLALFAIQHSGMARPACKRWLTRFVPEAAERSTYVLPSSPDSKLTGSCRCSVCTLRAVDCCCMQRS